MKASERTLRQLLHSGDQYVIPVFQRYYTWAQEHWQQLWEDLTTLLDPEEEDRRHFLGSIVCVPDRPQPGTITAYQVIDGQQRLTTLSILLCAIRDRAQAIGADSLADEVNESYLVHKFKTGREHYKLHLRQRDRDAYAALVDRRDPGSTSQIAGAHRFFIQELSNGPYASDEAALRRVFAAVATRLDVVAITLDGENPYKIFKSLNSTGVDLEQGDLIRNHVFMALSVEEQDRFDDEHWRPLEAHFERDGELDGVRFAAFFRDVLLRRGRYIGRNGAFEAFEAAYPAMRIDPFDLLPELAKLAELYDSMEGRTKHPVPAVDAALSGVRVLNVSTTYPLLLRLLTAHAQGRLDDAALARCLRMISSFVLRRYVCVESSRAYARWFCVVCKDLDGEIESNLATFLKSKGWPDDTRFTQAFAKMDLYNSKYSRAILDGIEVSLQRASEPVALHKCSIEHVMPQAIENDGNGEAWMAMLGEDWREGHASWLHTPGNLTLVGQDYNSSMSNRPFQEKRPVLSASKVYLNQYFADPRLSRWSGEQIEARGQALARRAAAIWTVPS